MQASAFLRQSAEGNGQWRFEHSRGGQVVTGAGPLHDALVTINAAVSAGDCRRRSARPPPANIARRCCRELLDCWMNGMLELYIDPPAVLAQASGDKPRASTVARYLAAQNHAPTNRRHASVTVDETQRRFIQLLDGTRTRDQLATGLGTARSNIDELIRFSLNAALLEE